MQTIRVLPGITADCDCNQNAEKFINQPHGRRINFLLENCHLRWRWCCDRAHNIPKIAGFHTATESNRDRWRSMLTLRSRRNATRKKPAEIHNLITENRRWTISCLSNSPKLNDGISDWMTAPTANFNRTDFISDYRLCSKFQWKLHQINSQRLPCHACGITITTQKLKKRRSDFDLCGQRFTNSSHSACALFAYVLSCVFVINWPKKKKHNLLRGRRISVISHQWRTSYERKAQHIGWRKNKLKWNGKTIPMLCLVVKMDFTGKKEYEMRGGNRNICRWWFGSTVRARLAIFDGRAMWYDAMVSASNFCET